MKSKQIISTAIVGLLASATLLNGKAHSEKSIVTTADEAGVFTTLLAAAQAAGIAGWIDDATPKTVFAPTDDAFAALPAGTVDTLLLPENKDQLVNILRYHIVFGEVMSTDLSDGIVTTSSQAGLKVSTTGGVMLNDSAMVTTADIEAKNGIIHIVDQVLLPPSDNIVDIIVADPDYSTLVAALQAANLVETVRDSKPFTVFAPTNAAFDALPDGTLDTLLDPNNIAMLQNILLYHVAGSNIYSSDLKNGPISVLNGGTLTINLAGPVFGFPGGGANPVTVDSLGFNGVVHKIDTVLLPGSDTLVDALSGAGTFATLLQVAGVAEIAQTLIDIKGATVFAPTDEAFGKLPAETLAVLLAPENKQLLANVLLYHVVPQNIYANSIMTRAYPTAVNREIRVDVMESGVMVGGSAKVTATDLIAGNGVVHTIDSVILPPANTADTLAQWPQYSTLVAALKAANLYDTLNTPGPFTLFAPNNAAFDKLPAGTLEDLLKPENLETLQSILLAHVVSGKFYGGSLLRGPQATLQGKEIVTHIVHGEFKIGDEADFIATDQPTWNGVIHSIDTVLLP